MDIQLVVTPEDAERLLSILSSFVVPFLISYLKRSDWSNWEKFSLAALVSVAAGVLSAILAYSTQGQPIPPTSVVEAVIIVLSFATTHYQTWFKGTGLENWLNPPDAPAPSIPPAPASVPASDTEGELTDAYGHGPETPEPPRLNLPK